MSEPTKTTLELLWAVRDLDDERLSPKLRSVMVFALLFREKSGDVRPSVGQLARATGYDRTTVQRALRELEAIGRLVTTARKNGERDAPSDLRFALGPMGGAVQPIDETAGAAACGGPQDTAGGMLQREGLQAAAPRGCAVPHSEDLSEDLSEDPPSPPPVDRPSAGEKRPLYVRREQENATKAAFAAGVTAVTGVRYGVKDRDRTALDDAIDCHCPIRQHTEARDAWITASAKTFREAIRGRERFHAHGSPSGWFDWLNNGSPSADALCPPSRDDADELAARRADGERRSSLKLARTHEIQNQEAAPLEQLSTHVSALLAAVGGAP